MALLKLEEGEWMDYDLFVFTFQYGSIKTSNPYTDPLLTIKFTFQYGSIKTVAILIKLGSMILFTFQYGSIKTLSSTHKPCTMPYIPVWLY